MDVAIVGAGPAGAGVAYALRSAGCRLTVYDRSAAVGGRTRARRRAGCIYDPGANYLKADDDRVSRLVTDALETDGLVDVDRPVWTFDEAGTISPGDDRDDHKWTYQSGLSRLVELLLEETDATVRTGTAVERLARTEAGWRVLEESGSPGRFDRVVLTPPAPATAEILRASEWSDPVCGRLESALAAVPYRPVVSVILHYPFALDRPYYALVNVDRAHPVSWVSREGEKRGHVPDDETLLVVQLSPEPSRRALADPDGSVCADAAEWVAALLGDDRLVDPDWTERIGWRDALVDEAVDPAPCRAARKVGLEFAGDWVRGEARVHAALRSGLEAGDRLAGATTESP